MAAGGIALLKALKRGISYLTSALKPFQYYIILLLGILVVIMTDCKKKAGTIYPIAVLGSYNCSKHDFLSDPFGHFVNYDTLVKSEVVTISMVSDTYVSVNNIDTFRYIYADSSQVIFETLKRGIPQFTIFYPQGDSIYVEDPLGGGEGIQSGYYYRGVKARF